MEVVLRLNFLLRLPLMRMLDFLSPASPLVARSSVAHFPRFTLRHCDQDLDNVLEETVPPLDLNRIAAFRSSIRKYAKKAQLSFCML